MASQSGGNSLKQACELAESKNGLAAEIARLSDNLAQSETQIAALNRVLELMRAAAGQRFAGQAEREPQALSA